MKVPLGAVIPALGVPGPHLWMKSPESDVPWQSLIHSLAIFQSHPLNPALFSADTLPLTVDILISQAHEAASQ
jgi:hypothetical protein